MLSSIYLWFLPLVPLALLLARSVRSWAHRRRGPRGAWAEVLDGLVLAGAPARPAEAAPSVGDRVAMAYGVPEATTLARAADRSAFAPTGDLVSAPSIPVPGRPEYRIPTRLSRALRRDWRSQFGADLPLLADQLRHERNYLLLLFGG